MVTTVDGVQCEFESKCDFSGRPTVLFLHGWGGGLSSFSGAFRAVSGWGINAINFAFPKTVPPDWGVYEYAAAVRDFLIEMSIDRPIIVGHSFGGRVAIILAAQQLAKKLVLVDSAGMKPKYSLLRQIKISRYHYRAKHGKSLDGCGSVDYNNIQEEMRPVFVRIVNTHLEKLLPYVKCPTLIFWGKKDGDTPPYMAKRLHRRIQNSTLVMANGGHYSYIDGQYQFLHELKKFITD